MSVGASGEEVGVLGGGVDRCGCFKWWVDYGEWGWSGLRGLDL